jgi:hypothetical protein
MLPTNVLAPEGRLMIAQQFTAGSANATILHSKSRRDGRHGVAKIQSSLRDERIGRVTVPSDQSLGYCRTTLRVEIGDDNTCTNRPDHDTRLVNL